MPSIDRLRTSPARRALRLRGFTLLELLITMVVGALLSVVVVPGFSTLFGGNQVTTAANSLVSAVNLTRSEAIKRSRRVTLCKGTGACTTAGDYSQGFTVFVDLNADNALTAADTVVREYASMAVGTAASGAGSVADYISFDSDGISKRFDGSSQAGDIAICRENGQSCVRISRVGRPSIATGCTC